MSDTRIERRIAAAALRPATGPLAPIPFRSFLSCAGGNDRRRALDDGEEILLRPARVLLLLLLVVIVASSGQAATASQRGSAPAVSGVAVSDVHYALAAERPDLVVGVSFTVAPMDAARIAVRLHEDGEWSSCARVGGRVDCRLASPLPLAAATELSVSAV